MAIGSNEYLIAGSCTNWWDAFIDFAKVNATASVVTSSAPVVEIVTAASLNATFRNFYNSTEGAPFRSYLIVNADGTPAASRIFCIANQNESTATYRIDQMLSLREDARIAPSVNAIAYTQTFLFIDGLNVSA